jgi:hypothetical protein
LFKFMGSQPGSEAPEEHHISLPGLELAFNHATKTVMMVDQTGEPDTVSLHALGAWLTKQGWFLHCVVVEAPEEPITPEPIR